MLRFLVAAACGVGLAVSGTSPAWAYDRAHGTGTSTARFRAASVLTITGAVGGGSGTTKTVTATIANVNAFRYWAHTVTATFLSSTKAQCTSADYTVSGSPVQMNRAVPANGNLSVPGITVVTNNNCKNETVTLAYSVS
ncbi:MAG: hypothetical protein QOE03_2189 [Micromonosporaceae bacterium]|nr:hypothetical protein [Micromonosporaceae bacterium]